MGEDNQLRRYTTLPYVVDYLSTQELVLPNPTSWDDRNDSFYLEQFALQTRRPNTYALCLTEAPETYHHWRVFSDGPSGVCVTFKRLEFLEATRSICGLRAEPVRYRMIDEMNASRPTLDELPFLKRYPYRDEREFRLFIAPEDGRPGPFRVPMPLRAIDRITLSPWLAKSAAEPVKRLLKRIEGCSKVRIYRSTLIENERWKKYGHA